MATDPGMPPVIGVIGGSGVYNIDGLQNQEWVDVDTPFGKPSGQLLRGQLGNCNVVFLPRHGDGHTVPPSEINFLANLDALKRQGVTDVISVSAVGSLKEEYPPGHFVIPDQFIDRTFARRKSFFGRGCVAHVSMAEPTCTRLGNAIAHSLAELEFPFSVSGTYLAMEGPQFSSRAESELYRSWGCDVIGMTNMPEAKLAREAEMCYATVAMVTDYDCWHEHHEDVSVVNVIRVLHDNANKARHMLTRLIPELSARGASCPAGCHVALEHAIITDPRKRDPEVTARLDAVAGRVL